MSHDEHERDLLERDSSRSWMTIGDDYEAHAQLAVDEEGEEIVRMESAVTAEAGGGSSALLDWQPAPNSIGEGYGEPVEELERVAAERLDLIEAKSEALAELHRVADERLAVIERQATALREARGAPLLIATSRVYYLMRLVGRWGWLEHRIRRSLR